MILKDVLHMMRRADKVMVFKDGQTLFAGDVNKCNFCRELTYQEVECFHPELLGGLYIYLK